MGKASENNDLEEAQRQSEEDIDRQAAADAQQDVEESVGQTEADIQEAMQETPAAPAERAPRPAHGESRRTAVPYVT
jgi:hypothetical protein